MSDNYLSRKALAHFLRSRREGLKPEDIGLPRGSRRRTPGLRREEVAVLAGVSPTWYALLEQARNVSPSPQVLDRLAQALAMTETERRYSHKLVQSRTFPQPIEKRHAGSEASLQKVCETLEPNPAYVTNSIGDILGWNRATIEWLTDFGQIPEPDRNLLLWLFTSPEARKRLPEWENEARVQVAHLRWVTASYPRTSCVSSLVDRLEKLSRDFRRIWEEHHVEKPKTNIRLLRHDRQGIVPMQVITLCDASHPSLQVVHHTRVFEAVAPKTGELMAEAR
ncbi:helix-turn-helix transcriptional regulator [Streptomyces sp. MZ04]|uniref:helix-turn-helix transcriptional regulator n=1 Tax=Streptomyces sp. MZ04 TaxID=2559236 RepID=UPI001432ECD1|nr:helix-turn-helix transcriptional regulator [Streptomyces sp. MZ04]